MKKRYTYIIHLSTSILVTVRKRNILSASVHILKLVVIRAPGKASLSAALIALHHNLSNSSKYFILQSSYSLAAIGNGWQRGSLRQ